MDKLRDQSFCIEILNCSRCPARQLVEKPTLGEGTSDAEVVFIGRDPGAREYEEGRPFVGTAGAMLDAFIQEIGLTREQCGIVNSKKCFPGAGNPPPERLHLEACKPWLLLELEFFSAAKVFFPLGNDAMRSLLGWERDSILKNPLKSYKLTSGTFAGKFILPLFHPGFLLRNKQWHDWFFETAAPYVKQFLIDVNGGKFA